MISDRIRLGRGVVEWVNRRGGELYLWAEPFSGDYMELHVATRRPANIEFHRLPRVRNFALWADAATSGLSELTIRRRLFMPGIKVDTGFVLTDLD